MKILNDLKHCKILASGDSKSKTKPTLLCHTGSFAGMYGPVEVTLQDLQDMVKKYLEVRAEPQNEFDYAPILKNHHRDVENVLGRLLTDGLEVKPWKTVKSVQEYGLYGNLRIDDEEALEKVNKGLYANVSITFDEETKEIIEVSFVAVEAARGSIVLSKGEKTMKRKTKKLSHNGNKQSALSLAVTTARKTRVSSLMAHSAKIKALSAEFTELSKKQQEIALQLKTGQIKNSFVGFIREGKMNPAELTKIDAASLALLPQTALQAVFDSYKNRAVSTDLFTFGQSADKTTEVDFAPEKMREAIKLQKSGKGQKSLLDGGKEDDKSKMSQEDIEKGKEMMKSYAMDEESFKKCLEDMNDVTAKLTGVMEKISAMGGDIDKLQEEEKMSEEQEKLAAEEDEKEALAAEEDDKDKEGEQ